MPFLFHTKDSQAPASRYDRLMRLQSALANSEKVQAAQNTITSAYNGMQEHLTTLSTVTTKEGRDAMLAKITNLAGDYKKAAVVAFPRFGAFVDGAITQLKTYANDIRQVGSNCPALWLGCLCLFNRTGPLCSKSCDVFNAMQSV